ncbi:glycosyltransferase family 4 protein [Brevundimonas sp.]|uniref:glycosyltransferase family 4 protein n=1 Tax=Brevundimonas sp. TaxID=1871086 RepID=UPI00286AF6A8|nr:glycosyltransferase family 4 protein [Brevundimonas sp.]
MAEIIAKAASRDAPTALFVGADVKYMFDFRGALMQAFRERGYRVVVFATPVPGFDPQAPGRVGAEFIPWRLRKAALNPFRDMHALWALWRVLREHRPRVIFAHTIKPVIYAMLSARLAGVPRRAAMIPGLGYAFTQGRGVKRAILGRLARMGYAAAFRASDVVLLQNPDDRDELVDGRMLSPGTAVAVVSGSGIDMDRFALAPLPEGPTVFLMVARLIRDKGVLDFVAAARRVRARDPRTRFVLVGAPDANPEAVPLADIEAWRAEGIVELRGQVADPRAEFVACHVFVLPSYYREGVPRTNLEALSTGRAVITTDAPGCRETVVDGVNGLLVPPRDPQALADAMLALSGDRERVRDMGLAGRRICADRFEMAAVTRITFDHIVGRDSRPL